MLVSQLLHDKGHDVATISHSRTLIDAMDLLRERGIGALVVSDSTSPVAGIISERDIVRSLSHHGVVALSQSVREHMSHDVLTCDVSDSLTHVMGIMTNDRVRHVPVLDEGRLVGIVSIGDVVKVRLAELERDKQNLLEYVSSW
jgi:CBS domain-containing protein